MTSRATMGITKPLAFLAFSKAGFVNAAQVAAVSTTLVGSYWAQFIGTDPWVWAMGGVGAAIVYVKKEATSRLDAITNGVISVLLAGIVSPDGTHILAAKLGVSVDSPYPLAFLLSASWPWVLPALSTIMQAGSKLMGSGPTSKGPGDTK